MFKQFDIDYDRIVIDGVEVKKPVYMSSSQWFEFWEIFDGEFNEFKILEKDIDGLIEDTEMNSFEKLTEFKKLYKNY